MTKHKQFDLDDLLELTGKFCKILNDEADRVLALEPENRTPTDIKLANSCLASVVAINKDMRVEKETITQELKMVPKSSLQLIVDKSKVK